MTSAAATYDHIRNTKGPTKRCSACDEDHDVEAFAFKSIAAGRLHSRCRDAERGYGQNWYRDNAAKHRSQAAARRQQVRAAVRAVVDTWLATKSCPRCGDAGHLIAVGSTGESVKTLARAGLSLDEVHAELDGASARCRSCGLGGL